MSRFAEIKNAIEKIDGQKPGPPKTVYVNPSQIVSIEAIQGGTRITLSDSRVLQVTGVSPEVLVSNVQQAML